MYDVRAISLAKQLSFYCVNYREKREVRPDTRLRSLVGGFCKVGGVWQ